MGLSKGLCGGVVVFGCVGTIFFVFSSAALRYVSSV